MFIDADLDVYNSVMGPTAWWPNIMQQTTIRALTKLEFAHGLASRLAEAVNDTSPGTEEMLGELLGYVEVTRNAVLLAEELAYAKRACGSPTPGRCTRCGGCSPRGSLASPRSSP